MPCPIIDEPGHVTLAHVPDPAMKVLRSNDGLQPRRDRLTLTIHRRWTAIQRVSFRTEAAIDSCTHCFAASAQGARRATAVSGEAQQPAATATAATRRTTQTATSRKSSFGIYESFRRREARNRISSEITFTRANATPRASAARATAAASISTACAPNDSRSLAFCAGLATDPKLTSTPSPPIRFDAAAVARINHPRAAAPRRQP